MVVKKFYKFIFCKIKGEEVKYLVVKVCIIFVFFVMVLFFRGEIKTNDLDGLNIVELYVIFNGDYFFLRNIDSN